MRGPDKMPEKLIEMVRGRIEAIRGQATRGQELGILTKARERVTAIKEKGLAGAQGGGLMAQGGIVERIGERFPSLKRVRGQLEPWGRPALFERALKPSERPALFERGKTDKQISGVAVTREAERAALF